MHRYTGAEIRFLEKKIAGRGYAELTELFNRRFGIDQTEDSIRYAVYSRGLTNGLYNVHRYTPKEIRFLKSKITGRSFADMAELFNEHFGTSLTVEQVRSALHNRGIGNGRDCRFRPGHVSHNKGKKGVHYSRETEFRPGRKPWTYKPVGTERINGEGYVDVRIRNPSGKLWKNWKPKHRIIWEKAHGKIPRGHVIMFADGNKLNVTLDNLLMVSRSELLVMNSLGLITAHGDLTKAGKSIADIKLLISKRKREIKKRKRPGVRHRGEKA